MEHEIAITLTGTFESHAFDHFSDVRKMVDIRPDEHKGNRE